MAATATALIGFAGWFVLLSLALAVYRVALVVSGMGIYAWWTIHLLT